MTANELNLLPPIFFPSEGNIDTKLFTPLTKNSSSLDCMVGYFTSGVLSELSHAIAAYLSIENNKPMRFIVSPHLNAYELAAIEAAYKSDEDYFSLLFPERLITEDGLKKYTISALAYLILENKIQLKIALKKEGLFHVKSWIFNTNLGKAAVHGSSNASTSGLAINFEQLVLDCSWHNERSKQVVDTLSNRFNKIWNSNEAGIEVIELNEKSIQKIKKLARSSDINKFIQEYKSINNNEKETESLDIKKLDPQKLTIPDYINYKSGEYSHQGEAVDAWFENDKKGILSIATGGGKTYTSLIISTLLQSNVDNLLIIISVPTKALMNQWEKDIFEFGINPINTNGYSASRIRGSIKDSLRNLRLNISKTEVILVTHFALLSDIFLESTLKFKPSSSLLILDEAHNIGSERSQEKFPTHFDYYLGLTATYERQFDPEGTEFLLEAFGGVVYEYGLDRAIGECLVPFNYYAHFVYLTVEEEEEFSELTYQIRKLSFAANDRDSSTGKRWQALCLKRRALIENAKNKVSKLASLLPESNKEIQKTLIFCTDKDPTQLEDVNRLLISRGINFHQITSNETSNNSLLKETIALFSNNQLQVLTSKRVLDEGFNVPQTETAYLLASNTVKRQWTQRLGRVLRLSQDTGKKTATIHDFVVIPLIDGAVDSDLKNLLNSEYDRVSFFANYSQNYMSKNGGYETTQKLLRLLGVQ